MTARAQTPEQTQVRFDRLVAKWHADTMYTSSITDIVAHPAYQQIIAMGAAAIPPICRALEDEPDHRGPALTAITGACPIPKAHAGRIREIAGDWLRWAKENGYEW